MVLNQIYQTPDLMFFFFLYQLTNEEKKAKKLMYHSKNDITYISLKKVMLEIKALNFK